MPRGMPGHIRSDIGAEFTVKRVRERFSNLGVETLFVERGNPWEKGYVKSSSGGSVMGS